MNDNTNTNTQQPSTPTPEATGGKSGEQMFSQREVNQIISDRLARERERLAESNEYKAKYEAVKQELESMKQKLALAAKEDAASSYFQDKQITGKALTIAMRGSAPEIAALELCEDGSIKDPAALDALVKGDFSGLVSKITTIGAPVPHPPVGMGLTAADPISDAFKPKI